MRRINTKIVIPIVMAIISIIFVYLGLTQFGFWEHGRGPMSGFYPSLIGIVLFLVSILALVQAFKEDKADFPKENWLVALAVVLIMLASRFIGMIPSIFLYLFIWIKYIEKYSWKTTIKSMLLIGGIVLVVFVLWLRVPFPKGLLFEALLG